MLRLVGSRRRQTATARHQWSSPAPKEFPQARLGLLDSVSSGSSAPHPWHQWGTLTSVPLTEVSREWEALRRWSL